MKKLLLVVLVALGLNTTQAQINACDSMAAAGTQSQITFTLNNLNNISPNWETFTADTILLLAEDSSSTTHAVFNNNPITNLPYDTLLVGIYYGNVVGAGCWSTWIFDSTNGMWAKMGMAQQPYFCCDSISYWTDQSQGFNIGLDTSGIVHNPDSIDVWWSVCTNGLCYAGQGMYDYFPQVTTTDTLKVGYDVYLYENGVAEVCNMEEWLIFDGTNWVLFNPNNPVGMEEIIVNYINSNKIYDLTGRELKEEPIGVMYIRNRKLYIKTQ